MPKNDNLLDHTNKVKAFADHFACLEVLVREEDIVITLFESLLISYEYLMTVLETIHMKEFTMDYVTMHLMHNISKLKKKEPNVRMPP